MPLDPSKVWPSVGWLAVLAAGVGAGLAGQSAAREAAVAALVADLRRATVTFAPEELDALQAGAGDVANPAYRAVKDRLIRLRTVEAEVRRFQLIRQPAGPAGGRLLADSTPADAPGSEPPGSPLARGDDLPGWMAVLATGEPGTDTRRSAGGEEVVSAYAVVRDRGPAAERDLLEVEVPVSAWAPELRAATARWAALTWVALGLPLGLFLLWRRRERAAGSLRELAQAVEGSPAPVLLMDGAGRILQANQGVCRQFGYTAAELVGQDWRSLGAQSDAGEAGANLVGALQAGKSWQGHWTGRRKDGSIWPVKIVASPVLDATGALQRFLVVLEDLTTARLHEDELATARERAETSDRAKGHFLATLSHEVRTPLNGVVGFASLLLDTPLTPEQREYAQTIRSSSEALIELTSQVLDFSRLEAGKFEPLIQPCSIADGVEDALEVFGGRAAEKGIELLHRIDRSVPPQVQTDGVRLRQILVNLVSNAVKFTASGEVEVVVTGLAGPPRLRFEVRDTGPGIPPSERGRLFLPFTQTESALGHGGTGLGLAISRRLVEALGGEISVGGEPGQGAVFRFTLPFLPVDEPLVPTPAAGSLHGVRIAVYARQAGLRAELLAQVESWGAVPLPVAALPLPVCELALVDGDPDTMEWVNGHPAGAPGWSPERVIGLVPFNLPVEARQVLRPRFATLLNKPVRHEPLRRAAAALLLPGGVTDTHTPFAALQLRVLVVEDNRVSQLLLQRMLDSLGCSWATVPNGRRALEELSISDFDLVLMDLHMPELDGVAATRLIRAGEAGPVAREVWIAAVTADARREQRERAFAAGVNDYVEKPITLADIEGALRRYRAERRSPPR